MDKLDSATPVALSLLRIVAGFLFFCHGTAHLFGWPVAAYQQEPGSLAWWAGVVEFLTGALLILGAGTRLAAFIASGTMAVAYFTQHQPQALLPIENQGDSAALFAWVFLLFVFTGSGSVALDTALRKKPERTA